LLNKVNTSHGLPVLLMNVKSFFLFYLVLALRYLLIAGPAFFIFYRLYQLKFSSRKIQSRFPKNKDYYREIGYSFFTFIIFALIGVVLLLPAVRSHTRIYTDIADYGGAYFVISFVLSLLIHDAYFYLTHRLMHHPKLFKVFHLLHHRSTNPSPWAAFAFSPLEAVVEGSIIFVIALLIPIHPLAILAFLLFMTIYNVYGHLGYEIYPQWVVNSPVGKWLNTSTSHNMHHQYFKGNYGLYFRFWDELFRTTHPHYDATLAKLVGKPKKDEALEKALIPNYSTNPSAKKSTTETRS